MRGIVSSIALSVAAAMLPVSEAGAAPKNKKEAPVASVKVSDVTKVSLQPSALPRDNCTPEKREGRVRSDVIFDIASGEIISSALYDPQTGALIKSNLSEEDLKKTEIRPASLTKLESAMEFMRQLTSGLMPKDSVFRFFFKKKQPTDLTAKDIVIASLNPSANLFDHPKIATPEFIASMNAYMKAHGRTGSTYLNATGYPTSREIREKHVSTLHDQIAAFRDYELNYAPKVREIFGVERISGLWKIAVPGLRRNHHTISVLETAEGEKAHPIPGVVDGKSGTTCNFGSGAVIKYMFNHSTFGIISIGHETGEKRDAHLEALIKSERPLMAKFTPRAAKIPASAPQPVPLTEESPLVEPAKAAEAPSSSASSASVAASSPVAVMVLDLE